MSKQYQQTPSRSSAPVPPHGSGIVQDVPVVRRPSSGTEGFFQEPPTLPNPFHHRTFQRSLRLYLADAVQQEVAPELSAFGAYTLSPEVLRLVQDSEITLPRTEPLDSFGRPKNALITSEGWRTLTALHHKEGLVAIGFEDRFGQYDRLHQFLKAALWSPSSGGVTCPAAMQDGAATLIKRLLHTGQVEKTLQPILQGAYDKLTSRDPARAWTSGQWMTERPGGSDVRDTETRAVYSSTASPAIASDGSPLGPWEISGFKWFSSATDSDMTVLLSKTDGSDNVSLFYLPVRTAGPSPSTPKAALPFNGITIQRLKNKLGTKSLPTAELILARARGYLLGKEGQGTKEISTVLNITRIHNAVGAVTAWARALAVSAAFSRVRRVGGALLMDTPLHVRGLAAQQTSCHTHTLLVFFVVALLGRTEHASTASSSPPASRLVPLDVAACAHLLRLLTPMLKATTASRGIDGVRFSLESLGGVGYLENSEVELNLAKLLRDTQVLSIWEGTADVQAMDTVRVLTGRSGAEVLAAFGMWVEGATARWSEGEGRAWAATALVGRRLAALKGLLATRQPREIVYHARAAMEHIACIGCTVVLVEDACSDDDAVAWKMVERWVAQQDDTGGSGSGAVVAESAKEGAAWDRRIVFELQGSSEPVAKL